MLITNIESKFENVTYTVCTNLHREWNIETLTKNVRYGRQKHTAHIAENWLLLMHINKRHSHTQWLNRNY